MKKLFTICTFSLLLLAADVNAQKRALSELPRQVSQSFNYKYKQVQVSNWELEEDFYVIEFTKDNQHYEASFNLAGVWTRTEKRIKFDAMPAAVTSSFKKGEFGKLKVSEANEVTFAGFEDKPLYLLEVAGNTEDYDLYYDKEGMLIMKVFNTQLKITQDDQTHWKKQSRGK